jgi:hypothetical protein
MCVRINIKPQKKKKGSNNRRSIFAPTSVEYEIGKKCKIRSLGNIIVEDEGDE